MKALMAILLIIASTQLSASTEEGRKCMIESSFLTNAVWAKQPKVDKKRIFTDRSYGRQFREIYLEQCLEKKGLLNEYLELVESPSLHRYENEDF